MDKEKLKYIYSEIKKEVDIKENGTKEFTLLCEIIIRLDILIKRLENPEKYKNLDKLEYDN